MGVNALPAAPRLLPPSLAPWDGGGSDREIAVLMSGGVDSSVTAFLLKEAGWKVVGITMVVPIASEAEAPRTCCGAEAARVCAVLGIPHYFLDVRGAFDAQVLEPFRRAYAEGRTPSPCVDCNTFLKFRVVWDFVESSLGVSWLATGHYAQVVGSREPRLARAADKGRDQSYFLYGVPRHRLGRLVLPVGGLEKRAVRGSAHAAGLPVADKPDSMELCFAGEGDYRCALGLAHEGEEGPILDASGNMQGRHRGIANYTLGQRHGLGIASGKPLYVTRISPRDNSITVGSREEAERTRVGAEAVNLLVSEPPRAGDRLLGKIRSSGEPAICTVTAASATAFAVEFDSPVFAPTPGQHLVLYDASGQVVGGGCIVEENPVLASNWMENPA